MSRLVKDVIHSAIAALEAFLPNTEICEEAADLIAGSNAPLIICGVGKSGHVGRKIASTFRSLGKQAFFIHASEASHGDLGCFSGGGAVLVLSNSGETSELSDIIHFCQANQNPMIAITGRSGSTLAEASDIAVIYGDVKEGDQLGLAPTTTTTLMMVIGDALAVSYADKTGFSSEDFAGFHPGGNLGARLKTVADVMRVGDALPTISADADIKDVILIMGEKALGLAVLMDGKKVFGILTDGDLRRHMGEIWEARPRDMATQQPISVAPSENIGEVTKMMSDKGITQSLVMDDGKLAGIIHMHDCINL